MAAPVDNASFYANFAELNALKRDAKTQSKDSLRAAAQQFESLFTQMMLKSMRDATKSVGDQLTGSDTVDFYQSMYDQQLASQLSKGKGLGLADMLVQQLTRSGLVKDSNAASSSTTVSTAGATAASAAPATTSQTSTTSAADREEFVRGLWPHAEHAAQTLGVDPGALVAQAALETGWGKNVPCKADGSSSYNLFGIKSSADWNGRSTDASTTEFEQGTAVRKVEKFKSYDSAAECFADYANLLNGSSRYSASRNTGSNIDRFAQALQQGGYATDPQYANKLKAVARTVNALVNTTTTQETAT